MMELLNFITIAILYQSCASRNAFALNVGKYQCKSCFDKNSELSDEAIKEMRYGYLKETFLRKLHLAAPPETNLPKPSIEPLLAIEEMTRNETSATGENALKSESVVIYPLEGKKACPGVPSCYLYKFAVTAVWNDSLSAEAMFFRQDVKTTLEVELLNISSSRFKASTLILSEKKEDDKSHFVMFDVINLLRDITRSPILYLRVTHHTNNSTDGTTVTETAIEDPVVVLQVKSKKGQSRKKRSSQCVEDSVACCRESFHVDFAEMGWDNWILHPEGYEANFCRGQCANDLSNTRFYHSTVILNYIRDNSAVAQRVGISLCCTPSAMSPLTIFYRNEENVIHHKIIDNMKVDECFCA